MNRTNRIILLLFLVVVSLLTYLEAIEPQPLNWKPSYASTDKIPLGTYVLYENLKDQPFHVEEIKVPPYEFLTNSKPQGIYFFLNNNLFFDDDELKKLLDWVGEGNTAFIAAENIGENLLDTLQLKTTTAAPKIGFSSRPMFNLEAPEFKADSAYLLNKEIYHTVFKTNDSLEHEVLGVSDLFSGRLEVRENQVNFLKAEFGKGTLYINTSPVTFSNFFLLSGNNHDYIEKVLGYLPRGKNLYWDAYYKTGKTFYTSPLHILLNSKPLKWAYYFAVLGSLFFVIFEGKRKQRSIPVIKPLKNQTFDFTRTISGLYLDRKDYKGIAFKKILLFLEKVRGNYRIPTSEINEELYGNLAAVSENTPEEVKRLFQMFQAIEKKNNITKQELRELNSAIEGFKKRKNNGKR